MTAFASIRVHSQLRFFAFLLSSFILHLPSFCDDQPLVTTLDGKTRAGEIVGLEPATAGKPNGALKLLVDGQPETVATAEIFSARLHERITAEEVTRDFVVLTNFGGRFAAAAFETDETKIKFSTQLLGDIALPLKHIRGIQRAALSPRTRRELAKAVTANPTKDVLLIEKEGSAAMLVGLFKGIRDNRLMFLWQDADREVEASEVLALALAAATEPPQTPKNFVGIVGAGDVLPANLTAITADAVSADSPLVGVVSVSRQKIAALDFVHGRRVSVSDLRPTDVRESGYFGESFGWQRDASVEGGPLRLRRGDRVDEFAKGLGTHARCELTYLLGGKYRTLIGVMGIDAETGGKGSANFVVLADGREVFRSGELKATDDPRQFFVQVSGAQTLTLRADFAGRGFDVAAHADWADLQLIE